MKVRLLLVSSTLAFLVCACRPDQRKYSYWTGQFSEQEVREIAQEELVKCCALRGCAGTKFEPPYIDGSGQVVSWAVMYKSRQLPYHGVTITLDRYGRVECHHSSTDDFSQ